MRRQVLLAGAAAWALVAGQAGLALAGPATSGWTAGAPRAAWRPLTRPEAARLSVGVNRPVIVFLKDQPALAPGRPRMMAARWLAIAASQAPLLRELREVGARRIITYRLVNSLAATVSAGEEARLKANPAVAKVITDEVIQGPVASRPAAPGPARPARARSARITPMRGACLPHGKAQLEPEALPLTGVVSSNLKAKTARSLGFTGAGVKVAWIADGLDPRDVNFIRPDGKSVFSVYRDFTGDGMQSVTAAWSSGRH